MLEVRCTLRVHAFGIILLLASSCLPVHAQDSTHSLQMQMIEMKSAIESLRAEIQQSRSENMMLRQELELIHDQLVKLAPANTPANTDAEQPLEKLEEEQQLLTAKVEEQHQTKIESASRYPVRLSGLLLMSMFSNRGIVDNVDFPSLAREHEPIDSRGSFGGSLRQSLLGLDVSGPEVGGARLTGDLQFDFSGGFPYAPDGVTFGLPRLRTAAVRITWPKTTLVAGQDTPFFSPLSPGSIASLAVPALSYSGNLWTWIPQVRVEHRLGQANNNNVLLQGGVLDPLTGQLPVSPFRRAPQAGEASRQPAYATRVAWNRPISGQSFTLGIGGYYSRQDWGFDRNVDAWATTSDWTVPLINRWELSGEFYRGRAIGGLGGGIGRSVLISGLITDPATQVKGLNSMGGWTQIKFRQTEKLEWNAAFGQDSLRAKDVRAFPGLEDSYIDSSFARNRTSLINFIYRLRSDLLLSIEYRRLRTSSIHGYSNVADHINFGMGVLF
jgi:hypothetical protein